TSGWRIIVRLGNSIISMKEYQAVMVKLTRHTRENEDTLTDLLNERSRSGWEPTLISERGEQLVLIFCRSAEG
ncbi:MAG: hypothetical protein ABI026_04305, partial [Gemmatimonadaceae bacterium]